MLRQQFEADAAGFAGAWEPSAAIGVARSFCSPYPSPHGYFPVAHKGAPLARLLEPDLARRSVPRLEDAELDRLYQVAAEFGGAERSMDDIYDDHRAFHLALLAPAASAWDIRILTMSERVSERYVRIGFGLLDPDPSEHDRRREAHQLLVDEFRKRDPEAAARALNEHLAHNEELARTALSGSVARWPR